ncbi:MAG: pyridoxal-phosphate dependent enzyme [Planctomycetes bacterium]|nr:pyridoxal-phosphate dependent enzyme [Planctomycetota bacterium]
MLLTLGEGNTPLVRSRRIGPSAGLSRLYFKLESANPTGSFKDRFAAAAVSDMLVRAKKLCLATSSGNTGASLAAYCAAGRVACSIAIVETAPESKLRQMLAYGARLYRIRGFGLDPAVTAEVLAVLEEQQSSRPDASLQISAFRYSPVGMAGVRSLAHELARQIPSGIDHVFCPAGGGGLAVSVAEGFQEAVGQGRAARLPRVECVQPEGNNTIAGPLRRGLDRAQAVTCTTSVSGLQVATVIDGDAAVRACRATRGNGHLVSDAAVAEAQARLALEEGIFSEPAGATALAGALAARASGEVQADAAIVCLVTGVGFKDERSILKLVEKKPCPMLDSAGDFARAVQSES